MWHHLDISTFTCVPKLKGNNFEISDESHTISLRKGKSVIPADLKGGNQTDAFPLPPLWKIMKLKKPKVLLLYHIILIFPKKIRLQNRANHPGVEYHMFSKILTIHTKTYTWKLLKIQKDSPKCFLNCMFLSFYSQN